MEAAIPSLSQVREAHPAELKFRAELSELLEAELFGPDAWSGAALLGELDAPGRRFVVDTSEDGLRGYAVSMSLADTADLLRVAVLLLADALPEVPGAPVGAAAPTRGARLLRAARGGYRVVGDPWLAALARDELRRRGRPPGGRRPRRS